MMRLLPWYALRSGRSVVFHDDGALRVSAFLLTREEAVAFRDSLTVAIEEIDRAVEHAPCPEEVVIPSNVAAAFDLTPTPRVEAETFLPRIEAETFPPCIEAETGEETSAYKAWAARRDELRKQPDWQLSNSKRWAYSLTKVQVDRCRCAEGPRIVDISDSGFMYCMICRTNLDGGTDPLVYTRVHD